MTARDRMVIISIAVFVMLAASWLLVVSPERKKAAELGTQVGAASTQLATAESQVASSQGAQGKYAAAYSSIVSLGKAVPPSPEVAALIYQIEQATHEKNVEFASISTGGGTSATAASASSSGFTQMPFTFVFNGTFLDLYHLFEQLDHFTVRTTAGGLVVSGRLLTIQAVKLTPAGEPTKKGGEEMMNGSITATAYVLPATQGLTAGGTAGAPAGAPASSAPAATTASSGTASSPTAPAVVKVTP